MFFSLLHVRELISEWRNKFCRRVPTICVSFDDIALSRHRTENDSKSRHYFPFRSQLLFYCLRLHANDRRRQWQTRKEKRNAEIVSVTRSAESDSTKNNTFFVISFDSSIRIVFQMKIFLGFLVTKYTIITRCSHTRMHVEWAQMKKIWSFFSRFSMVAMAMSEQLKHESICEWKTSESKATATESEIASKGTQTFDNNGWIGRGGYSR